VEHATGSSLIKVDDPQRFPITVAGQHMAVSELNVTGVVSADVSRNVPVVALVSGRVVEIDARLGDDVTKGQRLLRIRSDEIGQAFSDYRKGVADESLAHVQLDRATFLYSNGAIAKKDFELAEDAEKKAKVDVETTLERLKLLGADVAHVSPIIDVRAPVSGVITEQNITMSGGVKSMDSSPNLFAISDISRVWIICDVYENDLEQVHVNDFADIRLNGYPGKVFKGRISNIGAILDPDKRTAKVRIEMENPGMMRLGMFVEATFHGLETKVRATVPASAIMHLHDRDWVYMPATHDTFRRVGVVSGETLPGGQQEILSGIEPGDRVVTTALMLHATTSESK
jgi:cobalt-zinc-cadmium efflux system membrane fusion protein